MIDQLLEINLKEDDDFLKIVETLTRIGIQSRDKTLVQTCHILHKRGKYYLCHFTELFKLDGHDRTLTEEDISRRNGIAALLQQWGLCSLSNSVENTSMKKVKIIPYKDKKNWTLKQNYTVGNKQQKSV